MPPGQDHAQLASDAELITRVRAGDRSAFGDLYGRHCGAALALARQFSRSGAEADDLVSEAFARVLDGMLEGKGPDTAFRAYLFTTLRNTAYDRTRKDKRLQFSDDMESHDVAIEGDDPVIADLEKGLVGKAFAGLPERWQTVLWHMQVEGQSAAEVGILLGMAPNAVSSLAFRAREGLREAYLQAHLAQTAAERCRTTVDRLGAWTRGGLSKREKAQVDAHLQECDRCPALAAELSEINTGLRGLLAPLVLGSAAVGYLSTLGPVVPLAQLGVLSGGKAAGLLGGSSKAAVGGKAAAAGGKGIAGHAAAGLAKIGSFGPGAIAAGVAAAAAVVVAGVAIALSSGHPTSSTTADSGSGAAAAVTSGPVAGAGGTSDGGGGSAGTNGHGGGGNGNGGSNGAAPGATAAAPASPGTGASAGTSAGTTPGVPGVGIPATTALTAPTVSGPPAAPSTPTNPITPTAPITEGSAGAPSGAATISPSTTAPVPTDTAGGNVPTSDPTGTGPASGSATTSDQTTSDPATSDQPTTDPTGTGQTGPDPTGPETKSTDPTADPTTHPTKGPTTDPTTDEATTPPAPAPASLTIAAPVVSAVVAGAQATVSVTITNSGGTASGTDQRVGIDTPAGLTFDSAGAGPAATALRSTRAAALVDAPGAVACTQTGTSITCAVPAVEPGASTTLTVTLDVSADAADGDIVLTFNGEIVAAGSVPVTIPTGYASVTLTSAFPIGVAAVNRLSLSAVLGPGVRNGGTITVGGPRFTVLDVVGTTACTITDGAVTCPSTQAAAGIQLDALVAPGAGPAALTFTAVDARSRSVATSGNLAVSTSGIGGFGSVTLAGPVGPLRAGSTATVTLTATALDAGIVDPGTIGLPLALSPGISVVDDPALLPLGCQVVADDLLCDPAARGPLSPTVPVRFQIPIQVSSTATGDQKLAPATLPAGTADLTDTAAPVTVDPTSSGYDSISLDPGGILTAGLMGELTLDATAGRGVTQPGSITLPRRLSPGLLLTGSSTCTAGADAFTCTADEVAAHPTFTVAVLPSTTGGQSQPADAALDGDRTQAVEPAIAVTPRLPGAPIDLTGPFAGSLAAAETLYCPTGNSRGSCQGGRLSPADVVRDITTGTGDVISAELTWTAGSPDPARGDYDTVTVTIDGATPDAVQENVTGVRPDQIAADTPGKMYPRVVDLLNYPALAARLAQPGSHTILVTGLKARTSAASISAMAAWSLSTLWVAADPSVLVQIQTSDAGQPLTSSNGPAGQAALLPGGAPVADLQFVVWAPDPSAFKTVTFAGATPLPLSVTGVYVRPDKRSIAVGYALVHPDLGSLGADARSRPSTFSDRPPGDDDLWIGPMLVVRSVSSQ